MPRSLILPTFVSNTSKSWVSREFETNGSAPVSTSWISNSDQGSFAVHLAHASPWAARWCMRAPVLAGAYSQSRRTNNLCTSSSSEHSINGRHTVAVKFRNRTACLMPEAHRLALVDSNCKHRTLRTLTTAYTVQRRPCDGNVFVKSMIWRWSVKELPAVGRHRQRAISARLVQSRRYTRTQRARITACNSEALNSSPAAPPPGATCPWTRSWYIHPNWQRVPTNN